MEERIQYEVEIPSMKTMDSEDVMAPDSNYSDRKFTGTPNYHLTRDMVKREIIQFQGYNCINLGCYDLNMSKCFQDSEPHTFG